MKENWPQLSALIDDALDMPASARRDFVTEKTAGYLHLQAAALRFLDSLDAGLTDFMRTGAMGAAATEREPPLSAGERIGAWGIRELIGEGGMGRVYAVDRVDGGFTQSAALKLNDALPGADMLVMTQERQTLADLDHPSIARILDGGALPNGTSWMVMERIDGPNIDRWCADKALGLADRTRLVIAVADGLAQAHARLVLHRDLKPSNILVDPSGQPRLIDFGIARRIGQGDALPAERLSLAYAAPELIEGRAVGPAADVYGLAHVLYELVSGHPLSRRAGLPAGLAVAIESGSTPDAPLQINPEHFLPAVRSGAKSTLSADIAAILECALRDDPDERYPTMETFVADLRRALAGIAVQARHGEAGYQFKRWMVRFKWPLAAAATVTLSLAIGLGAALWQASEAKAARDAAVVEADRSEAVRQSVFLVLGEATEAAGPDGSRKDVLNRASERLIREFSRDPARYAPVLKALGELYFHSNDYPGAISLLKPVAMLPLDRADALTRPVPPEVIAEAKVDLAQVYLRTGDAEQARVLLIAAQAFWTSDQRRWRSDMIESRLTEAQIVRDLDKDTARAANILRNALAERIAMSGSANRDVAIFQNNLGNVLTSMGQHSEAAASFRQAWQTWLSIGAGETPDAMNTLNNLAASEVLSGRPKAAIPRFAEAIRLRRTLFGPSAALAALINNHAKALLLSGAAAEALPLAREATAMARSYAGEGSMLHAASAAGLSESLIGNKELNEARAVALAAHGAALHAAGEGKPQVTVALIALARANAATGKNELASRQLTEASRNVAALGPAGARLGDAIREIKVRYRLT